MRQGAIRPLLPRDGSQECCNTARRAPAPVWGWLLGMLYIAACACSYSAVVHPAWGWLLGMIFLQRFRLGTAPRDSLFSILHQRAMRSLLPGDGSQGCCSTARRAPAPVLGWLHGVLYIAACACSCSAVVNPAWGWLLGMIFLQRFRLGMAPRDSLFFILHQRAIRSLLPGYGSQGCCSIARSVPAPVGGWLLWMLYITACACSSSAVVNPA